MGIHALQLLESKTQFHSEGWRTSGLQPPASVLKIKMKIRGWNHRELERKERIDGHSLQNYLFQDEVERLLQEEKRADETSKSKEKKRVEWSRECGDRADGNSEETRTLGRFIKLDFSRTFLNVLARRCTASPMGIACTGHQRLMANLTRIRLSCVESVLSRMWTYYILEVACSDDKTIHTYLLKLKSNLS